MSQHLDKCPTAGKVCYAHAEARQRARNIRRKSKQRYSEYLCHACGWWHYGGQAWRQR